MSLHIGWPQGLMLTVLLLGLVVSAVDHGKPRKPGSVWSYIIAMAMWLPLLWCGGFFRQCP